MIETMMSMSLATSGIGPYLFELDDSVWFLGISIIEAILPHRIDDYPPLHLAVKLGAMTIKDLGRWESMGRVWMQLPHCH